MHYDQETHNLQYNNHPNFILERVKSFDIFWSFEAQVDSSKNIYRDRECNEILWTVRCHARLILSVCSSLDLPLQLGVLDLPDFAWLSRFLIPDEISRMLKNTLNNCVFTLRATNVLLFFCFNGEMAQFEIVTHFSEFDYVAYLSMRFFNHTRSEAIHNVSAHQLPRSYQLQGLNCFDHVIYVPLSNIYHYIAKFLTHTGTITASITKIGYPVE